MVNVTNQELMNGRQKSQILRHESVASACSVLQSCTETETLGTILPSVLDAQHHHPHSLIFHCVPTLAVPVLVKTLLTLSFRFKKKNSF